jgi:hypothetical protein
MRRATMFGRRRCCRCHRERNAEKNCNGKRDLSHHEHTFVLTVAVTSTDQGGVRRPKRHNWLWRSTRSSAQLGRPKVSPTIEKRILSHLREGMGILKVAEACKVGTGTLE